MINLFKKIKSWFITFTDIFRSLGMEASTFHTDNELSAKVSSMFENTYIEVIIYDSKKPDHYSLPGETFFGQPWMLRIKAIPDWITLGLGAIVDILINIGGTIEAIIRGICTPKNDKITFNPSTGKYSLQFKYARSYVSSACLDMLTKDEVVAMILQDVGDNCIILYHIVTDTLQYSYIGGVFITYLYYLGMTPTQAIYDFKGYLKKFDNTMRSDKGTNFIMTMYGLILFQLVIVRTILLYYRRRATVMADEFPIKVGYGEAYYTGLKKLHKYIYNREEVVKNIADLNFIDRISAKMSNLWSRFQNYLARAGMDESIVFTDREEMIKNKTERYQSNIDNNIVDRSAHIPYQLKTNRPIIRTMDKIHNYLTGQESSG